MATFQSLMSKIDEVKEKMTDNEYKLIVEELAVLQKVDTPKFYEMKLLRINNNLREVRTPYKNDNCDEGNDATGVDSILSFETETHIVHSSKGSKHAEGAVLEYSDYHQRFIRKYHNATFDTHLDTREEENDWDIQERNNCFYVVLSCEEWNNKK